MKKIYLRAEILRSISPRLNESAHIPDLTWKVSFFCVGLASEAFIFKSLRLPSFIGSFAGSVEAELELEENAPKRSDPSKLFNGTVANGSTMLFFVESDFSVLVSGCITGSALEKKSTGAEVTDSEAKRST